MKKWLLILFFPIGLFAQQIEVGSFVGINYQQKKQTDFVRYIQFHQYDPTNPQVVPHVHLPYDTSIKATEVFKQIKLQAQYSFDKRINIGVNLPYLINERIVYTRQINDLIHNNKANGIGDIQLYLSSQLYEFGETDSKVKSRFYGKFGIELPTGKFENFNTIAELEPNLQVGSESLDLFVEAAVDVVVHGVVLELSGAYKWNRENDLKWKFGDVAKANAAIYYPIKIKNKWGLNPKVQVTRNWIKVDKLGEWYYFNMPESVGRDTGGQFTWLQPSLSFSAFNAQINLSYNALIIDKRNGYQPQQLNYWSVSFMYKIKQNEKK